MTRSRYDRVWGASFWMEGQSTDALWLSEDQQPAWLEQKGSETLSPLDRILPGRSWKLPAMHSKHNKHPVEHLSTRETCSIVPVKDLHILVAGTEWVVEGGVGRIEARRPV